MEMNYDSVRDLYAKLRADYGNRNGEYDLSRQRYSGVLWDATTNPEPANRYSLTANYLKPFVDKSIQLLVGRIPAIQVMPSGTDEVARRHAESEEGILYGAWETNNVSDVLFKVAWDSFVLRRGLIWYGWDPKQKRVVFKTCVPDDFYPEYDGDTLFRAVYVQRRLTDSLIQQYPNDANLIFSDPGADVAQVYGQDGPITRTDGYTTVIDYYDAEGNWARVAGDMFKSGKLGYPTKEVPFIDFPCYPVGGNREPMNMIDQLVELNQYLCQVLSQKADIISRFSNPVVLDDQSGQSPEEIRRAISSQGSVVPLKPGGNIRLLNWEGAMPAIEDQIQMILDILFDLAGKPRSSFGQTVTNQSGVVTNLTLTPTLQSNEFHETIWGQRLSVLNERILQLYEKFLPEEPIGYRGRVPTGKNLTGTKFLNTSMLGSEIDGWYRNRIKWPSAVRVDDPVYVQNDLSQLTSDPPAKSLYTSLEDRGIEDVEAEIDRIAAQLEDPRFHPDRLQAGMDAAMQAQQMGDPAAAAMAGTVPPDDSMPPAGGGGLTGAMAATGNPNMQALSGGY